MIGVISDIHGNLEALESVLEELDRKKVDEIVCCGDIVGYGANPNQCCVLVRGRELPCVLGNHDFAVVTGKLWSRFNPYAREALQWTQKRLSKENQLFLAGLPRKLELSLKGVKVGLIHGSPRNPLFEYVRPTVRDSVLKKFLKEMDCKVLILGHTHLPFAKELQEGLVFNPGSVGQPRDGIPRASYALLEPVKRKVRLKRVEYDLDGAAQNIEEAGLPAFLGQRLYQGA